MTLYQVLCLIGFPSFVVACLGYLWRKLRKQSDETKAIKSGVQALLRNQMIDSYNKWVEKGYAPIYAKQNFENMWIQYHKLGVNGVMDGIHDTFMHLPTEPKGE